MSKFDREWIKYMSARMSKFDQAKQELRLLGVTLRRSEGREFRVNLLGAREATAYYAADLQDALQTGRTMSAHADASAPR